MRMGSSLPFKCMGIRESDIKNKMSFCVKIMIENDKNLFLHDEIVKKKQHTEDFAF